MTTIIPIDPRFKDLGNAVVLCISCNSQKHAKHLDDLPPADRSKLLKAAAVFKKHWSKI